jgi:hypothetical protein
MPIYALSELTSEKLQELVDVCNRDVDSIAWEGRERGSLSEDEQHSLATLRRYLLSIKMHLINEATLWGRAIYPLLMLAERDHIRAYARVPLQAVLPKGTIRGEVDGALAHLGLGAEVVPPYLVIMEAKRGIEGQDPVAQLVGGLLCAAWANQKKHPQKEQRLYGAYTIADAWTFVEMLATGLDAERPSLTLTFSREYTEKSEAATILCILKFLVADLLAVQGQW